MMPKEHIYTFLTVIRIITANAFEIAFQYDNIFSRGQCVYVFGLVVVFILVCLKILCINQHMLTHKVEYRYNTDHHIAL